MLIRETIVSTLNADGSTHLSPLGVHVENEKSLKLLPFRPSRTLDNLSREPGAHAVINYTDDVRVFAGCLTRQGDWPLSDCAHSGVKRLRDALAHDEVRVAATDDDEVRPAFTCTVENRETHRPFLGFNRAQAAVIELAILVSRLHMLPMEQILDETERLRIAYDKTAGERERIAWQWLSDKITAHRKSNASK